MNSLVLIFIIIVVAMWLGARYDSRRERALLEEVFADRPPLSAEQFHAHYFQSLDIPLFVSVGVREVLAQKLGVGLSRLVPSDSFTGNLAFLLKEDGLIGVAILEGLEKRFSVTFSDAESESMHTVQDIVQLVAGKVSDRSAAA